MWLLRLKTVTNYLEVQFRKGKVSTGVEKVMMSQNIRKIINGG